MSESKARNITKWRRCITMAELTRYSGVSNKRPGRLFFFKIFAFGTVIETGTLIFFPTFLESGTIIMLLSALVRLLGFEDCACETAVLKDCEQYDVQRKHPPLSKKKKRQKSKKSLSHTLQFGVQV